MNVETMLTSRVLGDAKRRQNTQAKIEKMQLALASGKVSVQSAVAKGIAEIKGLIKRQEDAGKYGIKLVSDYSVFENICKNSLFGKTLESLRTEELHAFNVWAENNVLNEDQRKVGIEHAKAVAEKTLQEIENCRLFILAAADPNSVLISDDGEGHLILQEAPKSKAKTAKKAAKKEEPVLVEN